MKKDQNSSADPSHHNNSLSGSKILRGRSNFDRLFKRSSVLKTASLQFRYRFYKNPEEGCYIGFVAGKRLGNAVLRNRTKRLLREAYRLNQSIVADLFDSKTFGLHGVFIARRADLTFDKVQAEVIELLELIRQQLAIRMGDVAAEPNGHS